MKVAPVLKLHRWTVLLLFTHVLGTIPVTPLAAQPGPENDTVWRSYEVDSEASLRGLHVTEQGHVWASGTGGTVIHTADDGNTWDVIQIPGAESLDVRDIHALDQNTVVAMTSGTPARIYRSTDAGKSWQLVFEKTDPRVFLDAMSFRDQKQGLIMGDPIDQVLYLLVTRDGGTTWNRLASAPETNSGEAGFAASGSNMVIDPQGRILIGLGGHLPDQSATHSRIVISSDRGQSWSAARVPMPRGPAAGIFSVAMFGNQQGVAVGGDYQQPEVAKNHLAVTRNGGRTWRAPPATQGPSGYRSCVAASPRGEDSFLLVAVGPSGTDVSRDGGEHWTRVAEEGFHAVEFAPDGSTGWAVGSDGRIANWIAE